MTRTALVTGSSGSIGSAIVKRFQADGWRVIGLDLELTGTVKPDYFVPVDLNRLVVSEGALNETLRKISDALDEGLGVLINNAAHQFVGKTHPIPVEQLIKMHNINCIAPYLLTVCLADRIEEGSGCVFNIGSVHSRLTKSGFSAYAASKAALASFTRSLAIDYGNRFRINCIEPASVATPMLEAGFLQDPALREMLESYHPQGRIVSPQEVAELVWLLSQPGITSLHGACIDLSGAIANKLHDPA